MNNNDIQIKNLLDVTSRKIEELGKNVRHSLETNGVFKYEDGSHFNINVANKITIVNAMKTLIVHEQAYKEACGRLGVNSEFKWDGYSISDWEIDFKNRVATINYDDKKKSIKAIKEKLSKLISSEGKTAMEIELIKASLLDM